MKKPTKPTQKQDKKPDVATTEPVFSQTVTQPTSTPSSWANLFVKETPVVEPTPTIIAPTLTVPTERKPRAQKESKRVVQQYDMNKITFKYTRGTLQPRGLANRNNSCYKIGRA